MESQNQIKKPNSSSYALVTGCSSGIGYHYCLELLKQGRNLVGISLDSRPLEKLKSQFPHHHIVSVNADLAESSHIREVYDQVKKYDIDLVINCAGFGDYCLSYKCSLPNHLKMIDVNVRAVHMLTNLFLPKFVTRDRGRIINISSIASFMPMPYNQTYAATKSFVRSFSIAVNHELKVIRSNVRVVAVCPGVLTTRFYDEIAKKTNNSKLVPAMKRVNKLSTNVPLEKFCRISLDRALKTKNSDTIVVGFNSWLLRIVTSIVPYRFSAFVCARIFKKYFL